MRSQRIAPPRSAGDPVPALANQRVIEQGHHGTGEWQSFQHAVQWDPPQSLGLETLAFKQTIGGGPVAKLLPGGTQQAGQGVAAQTGQGGQTQCAGPLCGALLRESYARLIEQRIPTSHHALPRLVFFSVAVGTLRRRRSRRFLPSTIHSTISPR